MDILTNNPLIFENPNTNNTYFVRIQIVGSPYTKVVYRHQCVISKRDVL